MLDRPPAPPLPAPHPPAQERLARRQLLAAAPGALAAGMVLGGFWQATPVRAEEPEPTPPPATPAAALQQLFDGNARFAAGKSLARHRDLDRVRQVAAGQKPFAAFLGCADSRVPIEIVFDQGFGDLFVTRIAGNVASSENIGSLEFGALVLKAKVLFVLGHSACGAVQAATRGEEAPGQISGLFQYLRPAVKAAKGDVEEAIRENVKNQAVTLAEASPVIARLVRAGELLVAGGVYDLTTGKVKPIELPPA